MYFRTFERLIFVKVFFVAHRKIEGDLTDNCSSNQHLSPIQGFSEFIHVDDYRDDIECSRIIGRTGECSNYIT
jgi:hypothetical protein